MVQLCWPFTSKLSKTPHTVPLLLQQCTSILSTPWLPDLLIICTISSISVFIMDINKAWWRNPKTIILVIMIFLFLFLFCNLGIGKCTWNLCPFQTKNTVVCVQIKRIKLNSDCLMLVLLLCIFFLVLLCLIHINFSKLHSQSFGLFTPVPSSLLKLFLQPQSYQTWRSFLARQLPQVLLLSTIFKRSVVTYQQTW